VTPRSAISAKISGVPSFPCSIATPANVARRIALAVIAWVATGQPESAVIRTISARSSCVNAGREIPPGPCRESA
jgi:hypothetical protein